MKVLIQRNNNLEFPSVNFYQADQGFRKLGWDIEYFSYTSENNYPFISQTSPYLTLHKDSVVVGGISVINKAYELLGVANPFLPCYPTHIMKYCKRNVYSSKIADVRQQFIKNNKSIFIKPRDANHKLFNGHILREFIDLTKSASIPDDLMVMCSEIVEFTSEYRVFVHNKKIVGMKHYCGNFLEFPATGVIELMVSDYIDAPIAYSLDVGIMTEIYRGRGGRDKQRISTALVEVNDATSLGCYGLTDVIYAKMIADRWNEVVNG